MQEEADVKIKTGKKSKHEKIQKSEEIKINNWQKQYQFKKDKLALSDYHLKYRIHRTTKTQIIPATTVKTIF